MTKIAVISDVHSNLYALRAAVGCIQEQGADRVIFLGDMLTYGCHPNEVVEKLLWLKSRYPMHFLVGNHDEFYFNHKSAGSRGSDYAQDFIKESIHWTIEKVNYDIEREFDWVENISIDGVFYAHANPGQSRDWSYIRSAEDREAAFAHLEKRQRRIGVFGHVHRHGLTVKRNGQITMPGDDYIFCVEKEDRGLILNYSVGQQRGGRPGLLFIESDERRVKASLVAIDYCVEPHLKAIMDSSLSRPTRERLISYFEEKR